MNTKHYKAASEATDADERALIPAFERTPNKAQHSPLPWHGSDMNPYEVRSGRTHASYNRRIADCREANCICYTAEDTANAALIVASVNHADELAEALRKVEHAWHITRRKNMAAAMAKARAALAAYEAAQ